MEAVTVMVLATVPVILALVMAITEEKGMVFVLIMVTRTTKKLSSSKAAVHNASTTLIYMPRPPQFTVLPRVVCYSGLLLTAMCQVLTFKGHC